MEFQPPTEPDLFPPFHTVLLHHVGAAIGFNPLRLTGTIGISAANIVGVDGALFGVFATSRERYTLPEDPGPELAPLAQRTFDRFSLAIGGTASLKVPFLNGDIPLLNSYGLYEFPDYFEFGGGFKYGIGIISIDGNVGGFAYPSNHTFNLEGGVRACLRKVKIGYKIFSVTISPCLNVGGVVSSRGLGFCTVLPVPFPVVGSIPVPIGAGYHWGDNLRSSCCSRATTGLPAGFPAGRPPRRGRGGGWRRGADAARGPARGDVPRARPGGGPGRGRDGSAGPPDLRQRRCDHAAGLRARHHAGRAPPPACRALDDRGCAGLGAHHERGQRQRAAPGGRARPRDRPGSAPPCAIG